MNPKDPHKRFYRRNLPHIQPIGATFFVTFRLYGSLPYDVLCTLKDKYYKKIDELKKIEDLKERNFKIFNERKKYLIEYDSILDQIKSGPMFLGIEEAIKIISDQLHLLNGKYFKLIAYTIMSNHVHILINTDVQLEHIETEEQLEENYVQLNDIMKKIKGPTARYLNRLLKRSGKIWERESFDMYVRNEKMFFNVVNYILNNPIKAGIVNSWTEFKGNYYVNA
jgi:putative transposase